MLVICWIASSTLQRRQAFVQMQNDVKRYVLLRIQVETKSGTELPVHKRQVIFVAQENEFLGF